MAGNYPGTTIEVITLKKGCSKILFDGIFAAGGITLSQVCHMTGLEPYIVQNWVKRRFVASPVKKLYSKDQFARIVIINMLRESLQIEAISKLVYVIGGEVDDDSDNLIGDADLYHRYIDMVAGADIDISDKSAVLKCAEAAADGFEGAVRGELVRILQVMLYAHTAARLRDSAKEILSTLM